jgi:hypothetical protein
MASPLAPYGNATLLFQQPTGSSSPGTFGTPETATTPLICVAFLKPKNTDQFRATDALPDGSQSTKTVEGFLLTPSLMPAGIQPGQVAVCTFWRVGPGFTLQTTFADAAALAAYQAANSARIAVQGEFVYELNIPGQFGVEAILGDRLRGEFRINAGWVDVI